jgi:hypothetical protein
MGFDGLSSLVNTATSSPWILKFGFGPLLALENPDLYTL